MIDFDTDELASLLEFLRDCPGRLVAVVVPGQVAGDALIERLRERTDLPPLTMAPEGARPEELGDLGLGAGSADAILAILLDGRTPFPSEEEAAAFFRSLNFQRESLAQGKVRTLFVLNEENDRRLVFQADDLRDWMTVFRFPEAIPHAPSGMELQRPEAGAEPRQRSPRAAEQLAVLQRQYLRAREVGTPETQLIWNYAGPLLDALIEAGEIRKAKRLWKQDLLEGQALEALPPARRLKLLRSGIRLAAAAGDLLSQRERAESFLREARAWATQGEPDARREVGVGLDEVGDIQQLLGDLSGALSSYQSALEIAQDLASEGPSHRERQRDLSVSYDKVGDIQRFQGDLSGALSSYRSSLGIREVLASEDPNHRERQRDLSVSYNKVGDVQLLQGDLSGALSSYRSSLGVAEVLASEDPSHRERQRDLSVSYHKVGDIQRLQGDLSGALSSLRSSQGIAEVLASDDPSHLQRQRDLAASHARIGELLQLQGNLEAALSEYQKAHPLFQELAAKAPSHRQWQVDLRLIQDGIEAVEEALRLSGVPGDP